jgi:hypothetical protein
MRLLDFVLTLLILLASLGGRVTTVRWGQSSAWSSSGAITPSNRA